MAAKKAIPAKLAATLSACFVCGFCWLAGIAGIIISLLTIIK